MNPVTVFPDDTLHSSRDFYVQVNVYHTVKIEKGFYNITKGLVMFT